MIPNFFISLKLREREREREREKRTSNQEINSLSMIYDPIQKLTYPSRDRGKSA